MFCGKCGSTLSAGAKFCTKCGWQIPASQIPIQPTPQTPVQPVTQAPVQPVTQAPVQPAPEAPMQPAPEAPVRPTLEAPVQPAANSSGAAPEKTKKKSKLPLIISLVCVALIVVGAGAYFFLFKGGDSRQKDFDNYIKQASSYADNGLYEDAIDCYKRALEIDPDASDIYKRLSELREIADTQSRPATDYAPGPDEVQANADAGSSSTSADSSSAEAAPVDEAVSNTPELPEEPTVTAEPEVPTRVQQNAVIEVRQVDNSNFPDMVLYASITDDDGEFVTGLGSNDLIVHEITPKGTEIELPISQMYQILNQGEISIELVMDVSGSMSSYNKMAQAKQAAIGLVNQMNLDGGDRIEVISFDDYVYLNQSFTSNRYDLVNAIDSIREGGSTALYDAIYSGLYQTNNISGAKCVIAFTDGEENASSYTYDDVVEMAKGTGIPVFIVGIGEDWEIDSSLLNRLADACEGKYYSASSENLQSILEDIYLSIYKAQKNYYVIQYTSTSVKNKDKYRKVILQSTETSPISGSYMREYIPEPDLSGAFSSLYSSRDYMIDYSSDRTLYDSDLYDLSLAQLRIARNEIFARHGRQFKDPLLNQWFYSKKWYLNIFPKYSPADFDKLHTPLSKTEEANVNFIKKYEDNWIATQNIFPNASFELLSEYDMALTKDVLRKALEQMKYYMKTDTLEENIKRINDALSKTDIKY